jgi:hypothetical protein
MKSTQKDYPTYFNNKRKCEHFIVPIKYSVTVPSGVRYTVCQPATSEDFDSLCLYHGCAPTVRRDHKHSVIGTRLGV